MTERSGGAMRHSALIDPRTEFRIHQEADPA